MGRSSSTTSSSSSSSSSLTLSASYGDCFRDCVESAFDAIVCVDKAGRIVLWNESAADLFGYSAAEIIGRSVGVLVPTRLRRFHDRRVRELLSNGDSTTNRTVEAAGLKRDGSEFPVEIALSRLRTSADCAWSATIRDISERKRIEEELRFKSLLLDTASDSVLVHTFEGEMLYVNESAYADRGYTRDELLALPLSCLDAPKARALIEPHIAELRKTGRACFESAHLRKDGSVMDVEVHGAVVELGGRRVIANVVRDITERVLAESLGGALNSINVVINSTLDSELLLQSAVVECTKAIEAETAMILLREEDGWIIRYVHGLPAEVIGVRVESADAGTMELAAKSGRPVAIDDAATDPRVNQTLRKKHCVRSMLTVPLIVRKTAVGVLMFLFRSRRVSFTRSHLDFATNLTSAMSIALRNAELFEAEHRVAETLQQSLLRPVPKVRALDIGIAYEPATDVGRVGGDFYDIFELENDMVAVLVGDVSGSGLKAAGLTETIRSSVRSLAYISPSPSFVLNRVNCALMRQVPHGTFATACFIVLDIKRRILSYTSAGHPPAILWSAPGTARFLEVAQGLPLGSLLDHYKESHLKLDEGTGVILYTDGLLEARKESELFGEERLLGVLAALPPAPPLSAKKVAEALLRSASAFSNDHLLDDIAIVALRT